MQLLFWRALSRINNFDQVHHMVNNFLTLPSFFLLADDNMLGFVFNRGQLAAAACYLTSDIVAELTGQAKSQKMSMRHEMQQPVPSCNGS
jgi:hypothetical protein